MITVTPGGYNFQLPNGQKVVGIGILLGGFFTGQIQCDPAVYGPNCGSGGVYDCGADIICAQFYSAVYSVGNTAVYVTSIPAVNVIKKW